MHKYFEVLWYITIDVNTGPNPQSPANFTKPVPLITNDQSVTISVWVSPLNTNDQRQVLISSQPLDVTCLDEAEMGFWKIVSLKRPSVGLW